MAATWEVTGIAGDSNTATAGAVRVPINATSAIAFGGGTRGTALLTAIQKDEVAMSMHICDAASESAHDRCASPHMHVMAYAATAGYCYNDTVYEAISVASPPAARGIEFRFGFDSDVEITACTIHAGTGANVDGMTENCGIYFCERSNSSAVCGQVTWSRAFYGSALSLHPFSTAANSRDWYVGISLKATAVGFESDNKIKIEATYQ